MTIPFQHIPVMAEEVLSFFQCRSGQTYLDLTLGGGGHSALLLEKTGPDGGLIGVDRDSKAIEAASSRLENFKSRIRFVHDSMSGALSRLSQESHWDQIDGVLIDCGVSSYQLDTAERGFSYMKEGPLDMRMNPETGPTAKEIIEDSSEKELADILFYYGEERRSFRVAAAIKRSKKQLNSTLDLKNAIEAGLPSGLGFKQKKDSVVRCFQAFRIAVNQELDQLKESLEALIKLLKQGARIAVITFQSLEDRVVKNIFRTAEDEGRGKRFNKKVIQASREESKANRRARSAKLRCFLVRQAEQ